MFGYIEVNDLTPDVAQYYEYEQQGKPDCRDDYEIYSHHFGEMILDKGLPCLGRRLRISAGKKPRYAPFGDVYTEHQQFAVNLGRAPSRVSIGHLEY